MTTIVLAALLPFLLFSGTASATNLAPATGPDGKPGDFSRAPETLAGTATRENPQPRFRRGTVDTKQGVINKKQELTQTDREAAARRAAEAMAIPEPGAAAMADPNSTPHYFGPYPNYANSELPTDTGGTITGGIRKFQDTLPGLTEAKKNALGQYIPVATPDTTTYPGSDYYEIGLVQYSEQMHTDLNPTLLRGYVQLSTDIVPGKQVALTNERLDGTTTPAVDANGNQMFGVDDPHQMGPVISATRDRPVRVKFYNLLPTGTDGNLFLPVDTSVMGAGHTADMTMTEPDPQRPMCGNIPKPSTCYTENRSVIHLHGGVTPWISDGTPHQWITPANETTEYPKGVSVENVPDMPNPGDGSQTFFYTNQQSARMMFYHDHSWGLTRLNVYSGEAAGFMLTDPTDQSLIRKGLLPDDASSMPLIVQDKTFVPPVEQLATQDPLWNLDRWGQESDLWLPHVYMPAQNPGDVSGVSQFGRWAYGPWFWPPTTNIKYPPIANPYFDPNCDPDIAGWCEPELIPGTPNNSMGMEAFMDTPVVNGTAYPTVTLQPKAYRFRLLNAANDRFFNLQFYEADNTGTEVALKPDEVAAAKLDPTIFPTPDLTRSPKGPDWIQIGSEGGFLPEPTVVPPQPITWVTDPTVFNAGNVDKHSLLLAPAERADTVVDFRDYAGKTLILYNDAPAAFPARDPRYDYYTDNADLVDTGGTPPTLPGYGPNTRTVMQVKIANTTPSPAFDLPALRTAFAHKADNTGVFESGQDPIVVGQGAYNSAYGSTFRNSPPRDGFARIYENSLTFNTLLRQGTNTMTMPMRPKAIQDEMGEAFDKDYGRMSGELGLESPTAQAGAQNLILYPFINPPTETFKGIALPPGTSVTPIASADDGTQIWKITHNGVDTHAIHTHLFGMQLINRVGWDGIIRKPEPGELGWKETLRISPLEDTIVAARPILPVLPFGVLNSSRPLDPSQPIGGADGFKNVDANGNPIRPPITNQLMNFGWQYVWHCHMLSHEEMDMMRPISVTVDTSLPQAPAVSYQRSGAPVALTWTDATPVTSSLSTWGNPSNETRFRIWRAPVSAGGAVGTYALVHVAPANQTTWTDTGTLATARYSYIVAPYNASGHTQSPPVTVGVPTTPPAAPTNLTRTQLSGGSVSLTWRDNATNETNFTVERSSNAGSTWAVIATPNSAASSGSNVTYVDTATTPSSTYMYRVNARNGGGASAYSNVVSVTLPAAPATPTGLTATASRNGTFDNVLLRWTNNAPNATGFTIQRSTSSTFTSPTTIQVNSGAATSYTDVNVARARTFFYRIRALNLGGTSGWSATRSVTTP